MSASCFASKWAGRVLLGLGAGSAATRAGVGRDDRLVGAGTGGSTAPDPPPFLGDFLAAGFFAGAFSAGGFSAGTFSAARFFAAGFFATGFLAVAFFEDGFFAVGFLAVGFLAAVFGVALFEVVFFAARFFAVVFFDPRFVPADFRVALLAAVFLTVFLAVFVTVFFAEDLLGVAFFFLEDADDELLFRVEGFRAGLMGAGR